MPILGLTQNSEIGSGLPLIARLHKGEKKTGNAPGKDLDYFRVTFEPGFESFQEDWVSMYGDKPDSFERVYVTYGTVQEAFSSWKEEWSATAMLHRCNGEKQVAWYHEQTQTYSTAQEKCAVNHVSKPCACTNIGRLNLLIPEFIEMVGVLGYVMVSTHSINDILTVYKTLADIERINGTLLGVPFSLGRATRKISAPITKKDGSPTRMNVNKSLFWLYPDPDYTRQVLLPRLASTGGFLSAQPQLASGTAQISVDEAKKMLGSGKDRRMGMTPPVQETQLESVTQQASAPEPPVQKPAPFVPPPHPDATPMEVLSKGLEENGTTLLVAANVLSIEDIDSLDEWRTHGKTPKIIADKVQGLKDKKPNPFGGNKSDVKTVSGTIVGESQKKFDELPGLFDEPKAPEKLIDFMDDPDKLDEAS